MIKTLRFFPPREKVSAPTTTSFLLSVSSLAPPALLSLKTFHLYNPLRALLVARFMNCLIKTIRFSNLQLIFYFIFNFF